MLRHNKVLSKSLECPPLTIMRQQKRIYEVKTIPQTAGSTEVSVQSVHIHSDQKIYLTVYNEVKSQSIISNANIYS